MFPLPNVIISLLIPIFLVLQAPFILHTQVMAADDANCHCFNPEKAEDGQNGFDCDGGKPRTFCPDNHQACFNDDKGSFRVGLTKIDAWEAKGIRCAEPNKDKDAEKKKKEEEDKEKLPPAPSPPCKTFNDKGGCKTIDTSLGELQTETGPFISRVFAILLSLSGGIALLLIIKAGYQIMTSQGKPETLQQGRDQLIAAIVGLLFLIFSFVLLQTIGVDILKLPGIKGK